MRLFESVNFKEFVRLLAPFSARASREAKLDAMFTVWDVDGDGGWAALAPGALSLKHLPAVVLLAWTGSDWQWHCCLRCAAGLINREDLALMLRQLAGSGLSEEELSALIDNVMEQAGKRRLRAAPSVTPSDLGLPPCPWLQGQMCSVKGALTLNRSEQRWPWQM